MMTTYRLEKRALKYFFVRGFSSGIGLILFASGLYLLRGWLGWELDIRLFYLTFALSLGLGSYYLFVKPGLLFRHFGYGLDGDILSIRSGVFVLSTVTIPLFRIQHVQTEQGPLLRSFGLAHVVVSTAGSVYLIPALDARQASALRERLTEGIEEVDE